MGGPWRVGAPAIWLILAVDWIFSFQPSKVPSFQGWPEDRCFVIVTPGLEKMSLRGNAGQCVVTCKVYGLEHLGSRIISNML